MENKSSNKCPCGTGQSFASCCGPYLSGLAHPSTPEALMRSRYTAYTLANIAYIAHTMTGPAAIGFNPSEAEQWAKSVRWKKLEVLSSAAHDNKGEVNFRAHFSQKGHPQVLAEHSLFEKINGLWKYTDRKQKR